MITLFLSVFSILFSFQIFASENFLGHAKDRGILITVTTDKSNYVTGDRIKFQGKIKVVNKAQSNQGGGKKTDLLEEFKQQGIDIAASYPNEIFNVTPAITLDGVNANEIKFSFESDPVSEGQNGQFSLKVFNNHQNKEKLKRISQIKAKIEKRILALNTLLNSHVADNSSQDVISYLQREIAKLQNIVQKISSRINSDENLMAENTIGVQVNNETAALSRVSTVMNRYRFSIETVPGIIIEGSPIKIDAKVTNLRKSDQDYSGDSEDSTESYKSADFILDSQYLFTSAPKKMFPGSTITYSYETSNLSVSAVHSFQIVLYEIEDGRRGSRTGSLTQNIKVIEDNVAPIWGSESLPTGNTNYLKNAPAINLIVKDDFGRINPATFSAKVIGADNSVKDISTAMTVLKIGGGESFQFSGDIGALAEGDFTLEAKIKDFAENYAVANPYTVNFSIDKTAPIVSTNLANNQLVGSATLNIAVTVQDRSPTTTQVFINDSLQHSTDQKSFSIPANLDIEGQNHIRITSVDAAGNVASVLEYTIIRDTTPPVLSNILPAQNSKLFQYQFSVSGASNEPLSAVTVDGVSFLLSPDKKSFSGNYVSATPGIQSLNILATDLAGNTSAATLTLDIQPKLLNPELISLFADTDSLHVFIKGNVGAARPGAEIKASTGLFSLNRDTQTAKSDGSFLIRLEMFSSVDITAKDLQTGENDSVTLNFSPSTSISGLVKDTDGVPLPGATVRIHGTSTSTVTDGQGLFIIHTNFTGDQALVIDGTTIPQSATGPYRQFSATKMVVNIGLGQSNVLSRPIYLAPSYLDGSEVTVESGVPTTVTSSRAPGVEIQIPANLATFPDGTKTGDITIATISSDRATVAVPDVAIPDNVVALEPSGLSFSQRVELTLPNENELPAGVRLLIYSMNSSKGIWEIDGEAQVTESGGEIRTLPGKGISHFSLVYAVPMKPLITEVKNPQQIGVDISQGSLSTQIDLPSFKSLGQTVSPNLVYKSNWANPTAYVSNIFDVPTYEQAITYSGTQVANQTKTYKVCMSLFGWTVGFTCDYQDYLIKTQFDTNLDGKSWYAPESIRAQLFVSNLASHQAIITDVDKNGNNNIETLPGVNFDNSTQSVITEVKGIPSRSLMSFAVPLHSESGEYLQTGLYPTLTRYEIRLKHMVMYTKTTKATVNVYRTDNGFEQVQEPQTEIKKETIEDQKVLDAFAPQDVLSNIQVVNKVDSEAGRGWKFVGAQKIINPQNNRILIEEADGNISTYAINNTIATIYDGTSSNIDFLNSTAGISWPNAFAVAKDTQKNSILTNINLSASPASTAPVSQLPVFSGTLASQGYHKCATTTVCDRGGCYSAYLPGTFTSDVYNYKTAFKMGGIIQSGAGDFFVLDRGQHSLYSLQGNQKLVGQTTAVDNQFTYLVGYQGTFQEFTAYLSSNPTDVNTKCESVLGNQCGNGTTQSAQFNCDSANIVRSCPTPLPGKIIPLGCTTTRAPQFYFTASNGSVGFQGAGLNGLNSPSAMVGNGNFLYIADTGNNRVVAYDMNSGSMHLVAGNGQNYSSGENIPAINAGLFHPKALAFDSDQNLYVTTEEGYIKRIDTSGVIKTVAGLPIGQGGIIASEAPALQMGLHDPTGLAFDNANQVLYVSEGSSNRVIKIDFDKNLASVVAGNGTCSTNFVDNQSALDTSICNPTALAFDDKNNLIILASGNKRILRMVQNANSGGTLTYNPTAKDLSKLVRNADGTWSRTYRSGTIVTFDSNGLQVREVGRTGNSISFEYNSDQQLTKITDAAGQITELEYSSGKLSRFRDPANRVTTFNYSGNLLNSVLLPDGSSKSFEYDTNGQLVREVNQRGKETKYIYNEYNRLAKVIDANSAEISVNDMATQSMTNNYVNGNVGQLQGAGLGPNKIHDTFIDAKSNTTEVAKDFNGYITYLKDGLGRVTQLNRDTEGKIIKLIRADSTSVELSYDPSTRDLVATKDIEANTLESKVYNQFGQITQFTNENNQSVTNTYDVSTGLLKKQTNPDGSYISFTYGDKGLPLSKSSVKGSLSVTTQYSYNALGQVTQITENGGKTARFIYDAAGNVIQSINSTNGSDEVKTLYTYDEFNRLKTVMSPKQEVTTYNYLATGELSQIIDPKNKITQFEYDNKGNLIRKTDQNGHVTQLFYEANGNLSAEIDPSGRTKHFAYNAANKLITAQTADDIYSYSYNLRDELTEVVNNSSHVIFDRDSKQRITAEATWGDSIGYARNDMQFSYNNLGQRTLLQSNFQNISYSYDAVKNRLTGISSSTTGNYSFAYDDLGRLTQISRPGSVSNFTYDASSNLSKISHQKNGVEFAYNEYNYDFRDFITQKRTPSAVLSYSYDNNGQLINANSSSDVNQNEVFAYDALGNRLVYNGQSSLYDNSGQQIVDDGFYTYVYDNNGNIIYKSSKSNGISYAFEYSALNQLKKATVTSTPLNGTVLRTIYYKYDPLGRRISRHVVDGVDSSKSNLRKYYYDGSNIFAEVDATNNTTATYTHSPMGSDDILGANFTSYATPSGARSGGQVLSNAIGSVYYLKDHLASVTDVVNPSGNIIQHYEYSAFGKIVKVKDSTNQEVSFDVAPIRTNFTYTGREYEPELGMYYYRARYYDPSVGRFLQQDPDPGKLGNPITFISKYVYVGNNPTIYNDPSGRFFNIAFFASLIGAFGPDVQRMSFQITVAFIAIVAGVYTGGAAAGALGFSAGSFGAVATGTFFGAAGGGLAGALTFPVFGLGNSEQGFRFGAVAGALGGGLAGYFGGYSVQSYQSGHLLDGIDRAFADFVDSQASAGSAKATTIELINRGSTLAGWANFAEPYLFGIGGGLYVNSVIYGCASGNCNVPKLPIVNSKW